MSNNLCSNCFNNTKSVVCEKCGFKIQRNADSALQVGFVINNRYVIGRVLGIGGFGITYKAMDVGTSKACAIKEYYPSSLVYRNKKTGNINVSNSQDSEKYKIGLQRFFTEIQILSLLNDCPDAVEVTDYAQMNNSAYMIMEFLDGDTLNKIVNSSSYINYNKKLEILLSVSKALRKIHEKGLLHRDISPDNIFITKKGETKLIDFGAARYYVGEASRGLSVVLKPGFAPPEQYSKKGKQGPWTDIYALASTFYYIASGVKVPPSVERLKDDKIYKLHELAPEVSIEVSRAVHKALQLDQNKRFCTITEFLIALDIQQNTERQLLPKLEDSYGILDRILGFINRILKSIFKRKKIKINEEPYIEFNGRKICLLPGIPFLIGRADYCDLVVPNVDNISRVHCTISYNTQTGSFELTDSSSNGTFDFYDNRYQRDNMYELDVNSMFYIYNKKFMLKVGVE